MLYRKYIGTVKGYSFQFNGILYIRPKGFYLVTLGPKYNQACALRVLGPPGEPHGHMQAALRSAIS